MHKLSKKMMKKRIAMESNGASKFNMRTRVHNVHDLGNIVAMKKKTDNILTFVYVSIRR